MKKIVLFCSAGMSTSMLVQRMQASAEQREYEANIIAESISNAPEIGKNADVILLGPQVRFNLDKIQKMFPDTPVESINMRDYGMMNGAGVLDQAIALIETKK